MSREERSEEKSGSPGARLTNISKLPSFLVLAVSRCLPPIDREKFMTSWNFGKVIKKDYTDFNDELYWKYLLESHFKEENRTQGMLLAEDPAHGAFKLFQSASKHGLKDKVDWIINAALKIKERKPGDKTLEKLLLAPHSELGECGALILASQQGYLGIVSSMINAAVQLKKLHPYDRTSQIMFSGRMKRKNREWTAFEWAAKNGHINIVSLMINITGQLKCANTKDGTLIDMLSLRDGTYGYFSAFQWAASNGHCHIVALMIDTAGDFEEPFLGSTLLEEMLLASNWLGKCGAFRLALMNGHDEVASLMINTALQLQKDNPADNTLQIMLLGTRRQQRMLLGTRRQLGDSSALQLPSRYGHYKVALLMINTALQLKKDNPANNTLQTMLVGARRGRGDPAAFCLASMYGHYEVALLMINTALQLQKDNPADNTLQIMLLGTRQGLGDSSAFQCASREGHHKIVCLMINAALQLQKDNPNVRVLNRMLLPGYGRALVVKAVYEMLKDGNVILDDMQLHALALFFKDELKDIILGLDNDDKLAVLEMATNPGHLLGKFFNTRRGYTIGLFFINKFLPNSDQQTDTFSKLISLKKTVENRRATLAPSLFAGSAPSDDTPSAPSTECASEGETKEVGSNSRRHGYRD